MNNDPANTENTTEELGGTTNLSLDQLRKEGGAHTPSAATANPDGIEDTDDLNEIRVDDDLDEPDADEIDADDTDLTDEAEQPEGEANEAANPAELNS